MFFMGIFSSTVVGPIYWVKGKMCATDYVNILNSIMLPYAEEEMPIKREFQQDNDTKKRSPNGTVLIRQFISNWWIP